LTVTTTLSFVSFPLGKQYINGPTVVGHWYRSIAMEQVFTEINPQGMMYGRMQIGHGNRVLHNFFGKIVCDSVGAQVV
jgi:hypothetical protein